MAAKLVSELCTGRNVLLAVASIVAYSILRALYNIFLHPLRNFPGPKIYAAFRLPWVIQTTRGKMPYIVRDLHEQYGPVVRIAPDELAFVGPQAWKDIYGSQAGRQSHPKDLAVIPSEETNQIATTQSAEDHGRMRRALSHAFSAKALERQQSLIDEYIDLLVQRLGENHSEAKDVVAWYNWTTFDIIGDLTFGKSFGCLEERRWHPWVSIIFEHAKSGTMMAALNRYGFRPIFKAVIPKSLLKARDMMTSYTQTRVKERLAMETDRPDFMSYILKAGDKGQGLTREEYDSNAGLLILAGSETTATLLSGLTYLLLKNPEKMQRLTAEIRQAFESPVEINLARVGKCEYLMACLNEGLRLYPPAPATIPRRIVNQAALVAGVQVPPNTTCIVYQYANNHNSTLFKDQDKFIPERWLAPTEEAYRNDALDSVQPFSYGPRNCIGRNLASTEMRLIIARILYRYDLKLAEDHTDNWMDQKVYLMWEKKPLMVYVEAR